MPAGIPKGEILRITHTTLSGEIYYFTKKPNSDGYSLYKDEDGKAVKIAKGANPPELEEKYIKSRRKQRS